MASYTRSISRARNCSARARWALAVRAKTMTPLVSRSRRWTTPSAESLPRLSNRRTTVRAWLRSVSMFPSSSATLSIPAGLSTTTTSLSKKTIALSERGPGRCFGACSSTTRSASGAIRVVGSRQRSPLTVTRPSVQSFRARDQLAPRRSRTAAATVGCFGSGGPSPWGESCGLLVLAVAFPLALRLALSVSLPLAVALAAIGGVDVAVTIAILLALPLTLASVPRRRRRRALLDHRGCNDRLRGLRHLLLLLHMARRIVASRL